MSGIDDLDGLRQRIRLRGSKVGAGKCVWADGFAMETIATHYQVLLLVVDERSSQKFTRIAPRTLNENGIPCSNGQTATMSSLQPTVLLHSSQREHMNLILYDGRRMQLLGNLPLELQRLWNLEVHPTEGCRPQPAPSKPLPAPAPVATGRVSTATGKRKVAKSEEEKRAGAEARAAAKAAGEGGKARRRRGLFD